MVRIKLNDLPQDTKISKEEMKKVFGGIIIIIGKDSAENLPWASVNTQAFGDLPWTSHTEWSGKVIK